MAEGRTFNLNRPEAQAKDEYLFIWQKYEMEIAELIRTSDAKFDPRIPRMIRMMISLIAHDDKRHYAETLFDAAIQYANSRKDWSLDERNEEIFRICATMKGNLTSYVDQFKGLAHQLKIGELVDMNKKYYQDSLHGPDNDEEDLITSQDFHFSAGLNVVKIESEDDVECVYTLGEAEGEGGVTELEDSTNE